MLGVILKKLHLQKLKYPYNVLDFRTCLIPQ